MLKLAGKLSLGICLMIFSFQSSGQELYDIFESYNTAANKTRNKALLSAEQWRKSDKEKSRLTKREYFNARGLPDSIIFFDGRTTGDRFLFNYDENYQVTAISATVYGTQVKNEFVYTDDHRIIHTYVRPEDSFVLSETKYTIYKAGKPALEYTIEGLSKDTSEIIYYNENGKEQYAKSDLGDEFIREQVFEWNEDNTMLTIFELREGDRELTEIRYYDTRGNLLKRMKADGTSLLASFEYDEENKMTISSFFTYKNNYVYDEKGYLKAIHSENVVKESIDKNLPEFVQIEIKYQFR